MKIRSDLPIKYYLNVHNEEDLRDDLAILFDILQYLLKAAQVKQKELDPKSIKFTTKSLKYIFGDLLKNETFKLDLVKRIKSLIESQYLQVEGETLYVTQKGLTSFYIIE